MGQAADDMDDEILQWVTFRLEGELYGINVIQVQEVLRVTEIAPVPGAPDYVLGIINLRGNVVTVIDTRRRFMLSEREIDDDTRIVIIEVKGQIVGLLVDGVAEVVYLRESEVESAPEVGNDESSKYIQGVVSRENGLLIMIDVNKLLSTDEWQDMAEL